jgi:hypothetical protein
MSVSLPNGSTLSLASSYGSALTVTIATNASPAVLTSTAHGLANSDIIEVTSGWSRANARVFRVAGQTANTFQLEGLDTTSTTNFPAGSGIGSVRKITAFTQITQILDMQSSGGDTQFTTYSFLEQDFETQIPTITGAQSIALTLADDPALAGYVAIKAAAAARTQTALKLSLPNSTVLYYNGIFSFDETPSLTKNQIMAVKSSAALLSRPVRY